MDNGTIWLFGEENTLEIVPVRTVWRDDEYVVMKSGVSAGQRLIVSDLALPVHGMPLKDSGIEAPDKTARLPHTIKKSDG